MAILPANQKDQIYAVVGILAIALAVVYYMYLWEPTKVTLDTDQARLDSLLVSNQRAKSELAQGKIGQLQAEADRYAQDLGVMRLLVPTGNEVPALIDQVSSAARRVGLDIADIQPLPTLVGDQYEAFKYRLSVRGGYHQIGTLLTNIGTLQRIVAPINLTLTPLPPDPRAANKGKFQNLDARFEIQTYVARFALPAPATPVGDPGPDKPKPGEK